jgi:hypothetical protein
MVERLGRDMTQKAESAFVVVKLNGVMSDKYQMCGVVVGWNPDKRTAEVSLNIGESVALGEWIYVRCGEVHETQDKEK